MKGLIQLTATKGGRTITSEVFGDMGDKEMLFGQLMNRHQVPTNERNLWKLTEVKLNKEVNV